MTSTLDTSEESYSQEVGAAGSERHAKIQTRAYELYIARGEQSGAELDDFLFTNRLMVSIDLSDISFS